MSAIDRTEEGAPSTGPKRAAASPRLCSYVGGRTGPWEVVAIRPIIGATLPDVTRIDAVAGHVASPRLGWVLRGVASNGRYATRDEKKGLDRVQAPLGRPTSNRAALIPIRKSAQWWGLGQDQRRAIFEESSGHISIGLRYLPAVARRLLHCRDFGGSEPFDFLTWFEYSEADAGAFDNLLASLRASPEWGYVDREVDIRLVRGDA